MNQQLTQAITLLQYTTIELKQQIINVLESNPLVELNEEIDENIEDHAIYQTGLTSKNRSISSNIDDDYINNIAARQSLREYLLSQTSNSQFNQIQQRAAEAIIDAIDDSGYLSMSLVEINSLVEIDLDVLNYVLSVIQTYDPPGVAASNTHESLLIQIEAINNKDINHHYAKEILQRGLLSPEKFDLDHLTKQTNLTHDQIASGLKVINSLNFNPGFNYSSGKDDSADPELYVRKINNKWRVFLTDSVLTRIDVNKEYRSLIKKNSRDKSYKTVLGQLNEAQLFVNGIKRRNETLLAVATYIVEQQSEFFENGSMALKSMNMASVADALEFHESTISRITSGKYIATPHGIYELKYFFPSHVKSMNGDSKSSVAIKSMIKKIIVEEDAERPYSDEDIALVLKKYDIKISRRTVTKYRESMNIQSSYLRPLLSRIKKLVEPRDNMEGLADHERSLGKVISDNLTDKREIILEEELDL
jgi:RNA polymerase sigma-54 factor